MSPAGVPIPVPGTDAPARLGPGVQLSEATLRRLRSACGDVSTDGIADEGRDWWPLSLVWAEQGSLTARPAALARPRTAAEVAALLRVCAADGVPVTPAAGRSGVCGGVIPVYGGLLVDLRELTGELDVDDTSLHVTAGAGTNGETMETALRTGFGLTVGHWPQSMALASVGGWVACRGAGQYSTRYGKIEDIVVGLEVALADGTLLRTGGQPRQAVGPDLTQLFVGAEGTLGVVTSVQLRAHPLPAAEQRAAYAFPTFAAGLESTRRVLRRGATPAVLRLYDEAESTRSYASDQPLLMVLDEADEALVEATMGIVAAECAAVGGEPADAALVGQWLAHRNDVSALEALVRRGYVVDTMEVAGPWAALPGIYDQTVAALRAVPGTIAASAHQSHSYLDGACLYFTFAGQVGPAEREAYYLAAWNAGTEAVLARGGALSHHHGVGLNRARFMPAALGAGLDVLAAVKAALDPAGILNPGKLGLPSPFGRPGWP